MLAGWPGGAPLRPSASMYRALGEIEMLGSPPLFGKTLFMKLPAVGKMPQESADATNGADAVRVSGSATIAASASIAGERCLLLRVNTRVATLRRTTAASR